MGQMQNGSLIGLVAIEVSVVDQLHFVPSVWSQWLTYADLNNRRFSSKFFIIKRINHFWIEVSLAIQGRVDNVDKVILFEIIDIYEFRFVKDLFIVDPTNFFNSALAPKRVNKFQFIQLLGVEIVCNLAKIIGKIRILKQNTLFGHFIKVNASSFELTCVIEEGAVGDELDLEATLLSIFHSRITAGIILLKSNDRSILDMVI